MVTGWWQGGSRVVAATKKVREREGGRARATVTVTVDV